MPQMSPLNWTMLFLMFTMIFLVINLINFYLFNYKSQNFSLKSKKMITNWKW
uniref:ATP synthase complex subunit 8 n=1 Tax=Idgia oculata TaxID=1404354 RepID=A0A5J6CEG7_9CUCU|nr:ATP synthase F0 subunit 8 [Idgia oculata]QEQ14403.1 ATP synthase F0 subunit 8 [Idgia oculata]